METRNMKQQLFLISVSLHATNKKYDYMVRE